jgi:two-component system NtrC family response regulator
MNDNDLPPGRRRALGRSAHTHGAELTTPTSRPLILVCDDEELIRWSIATHLEQAGYAVTQADDGDAAIAAVQEKAPALLLLDLKMPKRDGLAVLRALREDGNPVPVIVITAHGGVESAIEATRLGADAYLAKPFDLREVELAVQQALAKDRLRREVDYLRGREREGYGDFIGRAPVLSPIFETLSKLEEVDAPTVLITGESGTGKDVVARMIHAKGTRRDGPFMEVDCAALPEQLIESELFGHERGAFTDARTQKPGLFEVARGGVVFLDEIGELSLGTQSKLLRALENRTFKRVGGTANIPLDAVVVAATNRDLRAEVKAGRFREDLFFRLNIIPLHLPPLRQRREDIPALVAHFLERFSRQFRRPVPHLSAAAMELLRDYAWPGNVRELRNVFERVLLLVRHDPITPADLPPEIRFPQGVAVPDGASAGGAWVLPEEGINLEALEQSLVQQAMLRTGGNQSAAARLLGMTRYALRSRLGRDATGDDA